MRLHIAGPGCARCQNTEKVIRQAVEELQLEATVEHVADYAEIARLGVRITPAVLLDGQIILSGRVPSLPEAKTLITSNLS